VSVFNISGDAIFGRKGANEISKNLFALLVSLFTAIGVGSSAVAAYYCQKLVLTWPILIGVLVSGIVGILIAHRSDNPAVSLIGLLMVAIPLGCITGPVVALYTPVSVFTIFLVRQQWLLYWDWLVRLYRTISNRGVPGCWALCWSCSSVIS